jgi:hypothetical protein
MQPPDSYNWNIPFPICAENWEFTVYKNSINQGNKNLG